MFLVPSLADTRRLAPRATGIFALRKFAYCAG
jgi:hypothetical protein